jgi:ribose/xylose/arabinose/galactoside ABC-type transport system permease subunit
VNCIEKNSIKRKFFALQWDWKASLMQTELRTVNAPPAQIPISGAQLLKFIPVVVLGMFVVALGALNPQFRTTDNFGVILLQVSTNALLAIGATFVILTGGIDLSVGSVVGHSGVAAALVAQQDDPSIAVAAAVVGILTGTLFGSLNGLLVSFARIPAFVATLGTMTIAFGIASVLSNGSPISGLSDAFLSIGQMEWFGIQLPVFAMLLTVALAFFVLRWTRYGLQVYAVGGNSQASEIAGVNVRWIRLSVYTISGTLAGIAGVILASRVTAGIAVTGKGYELNAIAAAVIGGISLMGGRGSMWGTVIGFLIIGVLDNGLNIMNVNAFYQEIIKGSIIIGAVFIDAFANKKTS